MKHQTSCRIAALSTTALVSIAVLLSPVPWSTAHAEQASPTPTVQKPPEMEFAPRGQRMARDIKYGDWRKVCFQTPGASKVCRTTISGTFATGQSAVRADLIEREGEGTARLQLFLPVGLYLPAGVNLSVDQGAQYHFPYVWCLTNTCIAARPADPRLVQDMESGKTLRMELVDANLLTIGTELSLAHFAAVHNGVPLQIFEHEIDE